MPSPGDPLDRLANVRSKLKSVSDEVEDTGQFELSKAGVKTTGVPRWAMGIFGVVVALALLVLALAYALKALK